MVYNVRYGGLMNIFKIAWLGIFCVVALISIALVNVVYANEETEGIRKVYTLQPGRSYVLQATICTKDGKRKKVRLVVRVPATPNTKAKVVNNDSVVSTPENISTLPSAGVAGVSENMLITPTPGIPSMPENKEIIDLNDGLPNVPYS